MRFCKGTSGFRGKSLPPTIQPSIQLLLSLPGVPQPSHHRADSHAVPWIHHFGGYCSRKDGARLLSVEVGCSARFAFCDESLRVGDRIADADCVSEVGDKMDVKWKAETWVRWWRERAGVCSVLQILFLIFFLPLDILADEQL